MFTVTLRNYDSSIQNFGGEMTLYVIIGISLFVVGLTVFTAHIGYREWSKKNG